MIQDLLSKRGFTLKNLDLLLELEEAGSLVKVAKGDETRQGQYSRQLKELSECFGVSLTERQGRELKLTEQGQQLVRLAREMFVGIGDFHASCLEKPMEVSIGAGDSLLQWLLLPRMRAIQERVKRAHFTLLDLKNETIAEKLAALKLDFGIMRESAVPPKHRSVRLLEMKYCVFVPKSLLAGRGKTDYSYVLQSLPLARHNREGELLKDIQVMARQEGIVLNYCLTCEGFPQACRAVQSRRYAAILPSIARGDLEPGDYVEVEWPALSEEARWISLAWNPRQVSLRTKLSGVADCLKAELSKAG
jgi:DNA-binding transcriptional LysR family regulator